MFMICLIASDGEITENKAKYLQDLFPKRKWALEDYNAILG